jgi:hypothetical protein
MQYRTVSTKLPSNELTLFRAHCEKKGVAPAFLIKELILKEMKIAVPHTLAGKNIIGYVKKSDSFSWSVELDTGERVEVLRNVSPQFVEHLQKTITLGLGERSTFMCKKKEDSVPVPSAILRREKK